MDLAIGFALILAPVVAWTVFMAVNIAKVEKISKDAAEERRRAISEDQA